MPTLCPAQEDPHRRRQRDRQCRRARDPRRRRVRRVPGRARRRAGGRARAPVRARPDPARPEAAAHGRGRGREPDPRGVRRADPRAHGVRRPGAARARRGRGNERAGAQAVQRARPALGGPYAASPSATPRTSACAAWSSRCCATAPARRRSSARCAPRRVPAIRGRAPRAGRVSAASLRALTRRRVRAL